jgi:hypothetical protein
LITTGGKLWFAIGAFALVAAEVYFLATGGEDGGAITLLFLAIAALVFGGAAVAIRDGDASVAGEGTKEPVIVRSALPAPWPVLAALGAGLTIVGLAAGGMLLYGGLGVMGIATIEWMVQSWAERATGDGAYNRALRNRIMFPLEVPALGLLGVGFVILTFSRVLLAAPNKDTSTIIAIAVGTIITITAFVIASRPRISSSALAWVLAIAAVALLAAGVISGVSGERGTEEHEKGGAAEQGTSDQHETTTTLQGSNP